MIAQKLLFISLSLLLIFGFLPVSAVGQDAELVLRKGHSSSINSVAFSPDGELLASGSADSTVKIWDVERQELLRTLSSRGGGISSVAWSPDNRHLAVGAYDNIITIWDVSTGTLHHRLKGHDDWIYSVAWNRDGDRLASGSGDGTIRIWKTSTGQLLNTLKGHEDWIYAVAWNPENTMLASGSADQTVRLWDGDSGELLHTFTDHENWVFTVAWSPDGKMLASGSYDQTIKLWDVSRRELRHTLQGHEDWVSAIAWGPDGKRLVSGSEDTTLRIWNVEQGALRDTLNGHGARVTTVAWNGEAQTIASGSEDRSIKLWDSESWHELVTLSGHTSHVSSVAWNPGNHFLASGSGDHTISIWNMERGELYTILRGHQDRVTSLAWSPDGQFLASGSNDKTINVWDVAQETRLATLTGHEDRISSVTWGPDGALLASGSGDHTMKIWNVETGTVRTTLLGHDDWISTVQWSPDGQFLASGSGDGRLNIWDVKEAKLLHTKQAHDDWIASLAWKSDSTRLASGGGDRTIKIWNAAEGTLQRTFEGYEDWISSVAWNPDGHLLAFGSYDRTIKILAVETGEILHTLSGHDAWVSSVAWSPEGSMLASGSEDGTSRLWDVTSGEVRVVFAALSGDEWVCYHPGKVVYTSSRFGDSNLAVRFGGQLRPLYPIDYYREQLKQHVGVFTVTNAVLAQLREQDIPEDVVEGLALVKGRTFETKGTFLMAVQDKIGRKQVGMYRDTLLQYALNGNLLQAFLPPQPDIQPQPFRLWWERTEHKEAWGLGIVGLLCVLMIAKISLRKIFDPMKTAKKFFMQAGYQKIDQLSDKLFLLHPREGSLPGLFTLYVSAPPEQARSLARFLHHERGTSQIATDIERHSKKLSFRMKLYVVCKDCIPPGHVIQAIRDQVGYETIPLSMPLLQKALVTKHCEQELWELEEPYLTRVDPYTETKAILDPNWFYGRDARLTRTLELLNEGHHVGVFGISKIGKTSYANQLLYHLAHLPAVTLNCQAFAPKAEVYFEKILSRLHTELNALQIKKLPKFEPLTDDEAFQRQFLALFEMWEKAGHHEPFLLFFDNIERLFPAENTRDVQPETLTEYTRLFEMLRTLAQNRRTLSIVVMTSHPDMNRIELLTPEEQKNPMFAVFHEEFIGAMPPGETQRMVHEIGKWKDILWDQDAAQRVFQYSGGHPFVTRYFAGEACQCGMLKHVTRERVEQTAEKMFQQFDRHAIFHYYRQRLWNTLKHDERELLLSIGRWNTSERELTAARQNTLKRLEQFGLITRTDGSLALTSTLFSMWMQHTEL